MKYSARPLHFARAPNVRRLALVALCAARQAVSQVAPDSVGPWVHQSWTVRDGLPVNSVGTLFQSRDGYLWATTLDGLVRYDGVRFTVFNSSGAAALPTNRLSAGLEAPDGSLWFRTEDLALVRYRNGRFTRIDESLGLTSSVSSIVRDTSGEVWIGTADGAGVIRGDRFVPIAKDTVGGVVTFLRRRDGTTWIGTYGGGVYQVGSGSARRIVAPPAIDSASVRSLLEDPEGSLWIGTSSGLWVERAGALRRVNSRGHTSLSVFRMVWSPARRAVYAFTSGGVFRADGDQLTLLDAGSLLSLAMAPITVDARGVVWYAIGSRLLRDGRLVYTLPPADGAAAPPEITSMLIDREGGIWLATTQGLDRLTPAVVRAFSVAEGLGARNVYSVFADSKDNVWVGTWGGGLARIDSTRHVTKFPPSHEIPLNVHSIAEDSGGRLWVIGSSPLAVCEPAAMRCRREEPGYAGGGETYSLYMDARQRLWAGTRDGMYRRDAGVWGRVPGWSGTHPVRAFLETRDGALWIATNGDGIARWENGRFDRITSADGLPSDLVRALYEDAHGVLWVGTEGRGLAALDPLSWKPGSGHTNRRIVRVGVRDGLYDETIHQILADDSGRFWMNTNRGIFWVPGDELRDFVGGKTTVVHSTSYTERDGLKNREGNGGFQPAGARSRDGRLWFPSQDGVAMIDPARLTSAPLPPAVVERIVAGDSAIPAAVGALALSPQQRNLQIEYTASRFNDPGNVRFRYRLDPYDKDWIDAGSRRTAFYTRVNPGSYRFRVEVGSSGGSWNEAGEASVDMTLGSHFWETSWFRAASLAAALMILAVAIRMRGAQLRERARQLELVVAERTRQLSAQNAQLERQATQLVDLNAVRSRLFANLSHEFRTPLTLILGPLRGLLDGRHGALAGDVHEQATLMHRNGQRLLRLINQVLDLSKLQAGAVTLDRKPYDVVAFARGVTLAFTPLAERRGIVLRFSAPVTPIVARLDAEQMEKVLLNLLSNALKFTGPGGEVEVTARAKSGDGGVEITVRDTGVGIAPDQVRRVFDRFYQADSSATRRYEGTGIGLALAKELVELHGGTIRVESVVGAGSTFTVSIPSRNFAHLAAETESAAVRVDAALLDGTTPTPGTPTDPALIPDEAQEDRTTVLVVDDNADVRAYVRSVLAPTYRVLEAADGRVGLDAAREALPDLVIADVMMPELDGLSLARALKDDAMTDTIPVILLTARAATEDHVAGLETGADAYLVKPFEPVVLEASVTNLLAQRRRLRERFRAGDDASVSPIPVAPPAAERSALDRRLRPLVEARLTDTLDPEKLAAAAGMSYHQLYRALRDELETTPSRFIRAVRVDCARQLLERGAGSVTEVAYSVGFESLSYFSRAYRERFAVPPSTHARTGATIA